MQISTRQSWQINFTFYVKRHEYQYKTPTFLKKSAQCFLFLKIFSIFIEGQNQLPSKRIKAFTGGLSELLENI